MRYLGLGNGSDGVVDLSSYTQTWYSCSGTSGSTSLTVTGTFSTGDRVFIHQTRGTGVGGGEENTVASYVAGTLTLVLPLTQTYTDSGASQAQVAVVKQASGVTGTYTMTAWDGNVGGMLYINCNGLFDGTVSANAKGYRGGAGGLLAGSQGEGTVGAGGASASANGNGGGAGTDFQNTSPSGGGHATAGESAVGSTGGSAVGGATLTTLYPGGAGGGASASGGAGDDGGAGGNGGGIIVVNTHTISASSSLTANGENGKLSANSEFGGGGGAGGSVLLRCVKNLGTTLTATKGNGANGTYGTGPAFGDGGDGAVGRIRIETCSNTTGTESPSASLQEGGFSYCGGSAFLI